MFVFGAAAEAQYVLSLQDAIDIALEKSYDYSHGITLFLAQENSSENAF